MKENKLFNPRAGKTTLLIIAYRRSQKKNESMIINPNVFILCHAGGIYFRYYR